MIGAGILDGDLVVVRSEHEAKNGEIVVAGIGDDEATVKTFRREGRRVRLLPANPDFDEIVRDASEITVYGKVVSVLRRL